MGANQPLDPLAPKKNPKNVCLEMVHLIYPYHYPLLSISVKRLAFKYHLDPFSAPAKSNRSQWVPVTSAVYSASPPFLFWGAALPLRKSVSWTCHILSYLDISTNHVPSQSISIHPTPVQLGCIGCISLYPSCDFMTTRIATQIKGRSHLQLSWRLQRRSYDSDSLWS